MVNKWKMLISIGNLSEKVMGSLLILALACMFNPLPGQDQTQNFDIVGRLVDGSNGQPLLGASVGLTGSDWGSITDQNGVFVIPGAFVGWKTDRKGGFSLTASRLGYKTLTWEGDLSRNDDNLIIEISPKADILEEIAEVRKNLKSRRVGSGTDVKAYDRKDLVTSRETTALRFLTNRVSIPQRQPPIVFVDEVQVMGGIDYLDGIDPIDLELMEIFQSGRHVRIYTTDFLRQASKNGFQPRVLFR